MAAASTASVPITTVEHPLRNPNYRLWLIGGTIGYFVVSQHRRVDRTWSQIFHDVAAKSKQAPRDRFQR